MTGSTGQKSDRDCLRKEAREKRDALEDREIKDRMIREAFFRLLISAEMKPERIFIYSSFGSEADTHGIMKALLDMGTEVFCPKVSENDMHFYRIFSEDDMKPGAFGIREPNMLLARNSASCS